MISILVAIEMASTKNGYSTPTMMALSPFRWVEIQSVNCSWKLTSHTLLQNPRQFTSSKHYLIKGDDLISLYLVGSCLRILHPLWCFLLSDGEEYPSIMVGTLDNRKMEK